MALGAAYELLTPGYIKPRANRPSRGICLQLPSCRRILGYLRRCSNAQDTLEGIVQWWVLEQMIYDGAPEIKQALGELEACGLIQTRTGADGRVYFKLNKAKTKEIGMILGKRAR